MKFHRILIVSLIAFTLAACNFSLAEDITPPPGAELVPTATPAPAATDVPTAAASTPSNEVTSASPTPLNASTVLPAGGVTISGSVINGSGGPLPAGLTATLHGILNQQETLNLDKPVNPDGSYSFENVALTTGMDFLVIVQYGSVSFLSEGGVFDGTKNKVDQPVTIYDSNSDLAGLSLDQVHIQATFSTAGEILLDEIYVLTNPGKKAVTVATDGSTLPFASFPAGALQPSISLSQGSAQPVMADAGFAMLPGSQQYAFVVSFSLSYTNNKASLAQPFALAPKSVTVIIPAGVKAAGKGLADQGTSDFQGTSYQIYSAGPLDAGAVLALTLSGSQPAAAGGTSATKTSPVLLIGLGLLGLLLMVGGLFIFLRERRKVRKIEPVGMIEPESKDNETARLADAILDLDDSFANGTIDREMYDQQRAALKEKLKSRL
jgi:hypothetical protein